MANRLVSIIILNWNGMSFTRLCIQSIRRNTDYKPFEIIVVDNGSKEEEIKQLQGMHKQGLVDKLILNKENKGFAGGNNQGLRAANGDFFLLLNNDTIVKKGWLNELVKAAESDESIGIVQPDLPEAEGKQQPYSGGYIDDSGTARFILKQQHPGMHDIEQAGGAAFFIKKSLFEKIGFLDEGFSPIYFEESDYCARARKAGMRCVFAPESVIVHFGSKITAKQPSKWMYLTMNKNRARFMLLHFSKKRLAKAFFWEMLRFIKSIATLRVHWLLQAYWINLRNLGEILEKRKRYAKGDLIVRG
jgi:GT2 family glycosyltransferase